MRAPFFDPWTATEAEARAAALQSGDDPLTLALVAGRGALLAAQLLPAKSPLARWCAATRLVDRRASIETGDACAVLAGVDLCASHQLEVPQWLAVAFRRAVGPALAGRAAVTLRPMGGDEQCRGGPTRAAQDRRALWRVWAIVRRHRWTPAARRPPDHVLWGAFSLAWSASAAGALDGDLQRAVRSVGVGRTKARALFEEAERLLGPACWPLQHVPPPLL